MKVIRQIFVPSNSRKASNSERKTRRNDNLRSYGSVLGTEILRHRDPDGSLSGILFRANGRLITARHVIEAHHLQGFTYSQDKGLDIAYKTDALNTGLPMGWTDKIFFNADIVTSSIDAPKKLFRVPGSISIDFGSLLLRPFTPNHFNDAKDFIRRGISGSPIIYKNHIIGLITAQSRQEVRAFGLIFNQELANQLANIGLQISPIY